MTAERDAGSSLVELLIAMVLMSVLGTLMLSVVATYLRVEASPTERITSTRDLARITDGFARDVSSASVYWFQRDLAPADGTPDSLDPAAPVACAGYRGGGRNLVTLRWTEAFGGTNSSYVVQYLIESGSSRSRVVRVTCDDSTIRTSTATVADALDVDSPAVATIDGQTVAIALTAATGETVTVSATSLNSGDGIDRTEDDE